MQDKGGKFTAVLTVFLVLCYIFVPLRCFVRHRFTSLGLDDIFAILALLTFTGLCVDLFFGIYRGAIGKHVNDVPTEKYVMGIKTFLIAELLYVVSTAFIKIAFSITLLRIMDKRVFQFMTYTVYVVIAVVSIQALIFFFLPLFLCEPVSYQWEQVYVGKRGHCKPTSETMATSYTHGAVIFCCDTTLAVLVGYLISKLQLSKRVKIAAGVLLGLGSITSIVTIARFPFIHVIKDPDLLYTGVDLSILAIAEVGTGIITTSAGTLRPLFVRRPGVSRQLETPSSRNPITGRQNSERTGTTMTNSERLPTILDSGEKD